MHSMLLTFENHEYGERGYVYNRDELKAMARVWAEQRRFPPINMTGWGRSDVRDTVRELKEAQAAFDEDFDADPDKYIEEYCGYYGYDRPPTAAAEKLIGEEGQELYDFIMDPPRRKNFLDEMRALLARDEPLSERQTAVVKQIRDEIS